MAEPTVTRTPVVLDIGNERQLFVDDYLIDGLENVSRFVHQPVKHDQNPVFRIEKPWEGQRIVPMALVFDSEEKVYKYWYTARATTEGRPALAYALSEDGVNFTRPDLGLVEYDGSAANNLIALHTPHARPGPQRDRGGGPGTPLQNGALYGRWRGSRRLFPGRTAVDAPR